MVNLGRLWNQSSVPAPPQLASGLVSTSDRDRYRLLECIHNQTSDLRTARGFAGFDLLIGIGCIMTLFQFCLL